MVLGDSCPIFRTIILWIQPVGKQPSTTAEQEILVHFHELILPELVLVQDVAR